MKAFGTLYGIGVGPGSPDLLTLRAVEALHSVDVILAAASPRNEHSLALSIASPHLPADAQVLRLDFPMTRDEDVLRASWRENALLVAEQLAAGKSAAFLTLGDPLIYSTFGYLMQTLLRECPDAPIQVIPGITSFQDAAAKSRTILCEGEENLFIIAGINTPERLDQALAASDSAVILKAYKNSEEIYKALSRTRKSSETVFASRLGLEGESLLRGLEQAPEKPHYLSLLLAPPRRGKE